MAVRRGSYTVSGREVGVVEEANEWRVRAGDREERHRYLDRALARLLGGTSSDATRIAAEILRHPGGGPIA